VGPVTVGLPGERAMAVPARRRYMVAVPPGFDPAAAGLTASAGFVEVEAETRAEAADILAELVDASRTG
jgi:hypothetical protein